MITPLDITQREFKKAFRGFDPKEVKAFLEDVAHEIERLIKENTLLIDRLQRLEEELKAHAEREESLKRTLVTAQRLTDTLKENAKKEAELLIKETELKAERLMEQAHQRLASIQWEIEELKRQKTLFEAKLRSAIKLHLDLLDAEPDRQARRPPDAGPQAGRP